jgi:hypothetical protein
MKDNRWARLLAYVTGLITIGCRERLGGILRFYHRAAA